MQQNLYTYPARMYEGKPLQIEVAAAQNKRKETEYAAQRILEYTCEQGGRMRDVAILAGSIAGYEVLVQDVFSRAGIPFFLESKRALLLSSAAEFALSALDIIAGGRWRLADVLRHLKCGFYAQSRRRRRSFGMPRNTGSGDMLFAGNLSGAMSR